MFKRVLKAVALAAVIGLPVWQAEAGKPSVPLFTVSTDEATAIYPAGRDIVFTVKPDTYNPQASLEKAKVKVIFDGQKEVKGEQTLANGVITVRVKPTQPGWYRCDVAVPKTDTPVEILACGAMVEPEKIQPGTKEPTDLDAFWNGKKALLKASPLKFEITPLTAEQQKKVAKFENSGYECLALKIDVPVTGVKPVMGYLARPKTAKAGGYPAIMLLHAAGVAGDWCIAKPESALNTAQKYGAIVLDMNAHGIPNDMAKDFYKELEKKDLLNYPQQGKDNRDNFYFVGMYLRLLCGIEFLCTQKEWDGRHLITVGESQGGGQALAAAGLDARVSAVAALVPALCDFSDPQVKRMGGWPRPLGDNAAKVDAKAAKAVAYCDNVFLATRSHAETLIYVGLNDTTCPAPGIFATYNVLPQPKKLVIYPHKKHNGQPKEDMWLGEIFSLQDAFIKRHLGK